MYFFFYFTKKILAPEKYSGGHSAAILGHIKYLNITNLPEEALPTTHHRNFIDCHVSEGQDRLSSDIHEAQKVGALVICIASAPTVSVPNKQSSCSLNIPKCLF